MVHRGCCERVVRVHVAPSMAAFFVAEGTRSMLPALTCRRYCIVHYALTTTR